MTHAVRYGSLILTCALLALSAAAADPVAGFRGDGTGEYPAATHPPLTWSRTSAAIAGLRAQSAKPAGGDVGAAISDGVIRDWLILGPVALTAKPAPPAGAPENTDAAEALPDEAALDPSAGDAAGALKWTHVALDTAYLDFNKLPGKPANRDVAAYAFSRVFAPVAGTFRLNGTCIAKGRLIVNGRKPVGLAGRPAVALDKGWNRLLLRVSPGEKDWYAVPVLHARAPADYKDANIAWRTPLPGVHAGFYGGGSGAGSPVVAGDALYLQSEPHDLICLDRATGKVRWIRRASYFEAATDEDKRDKGYADAAAIAAKLDAINAAFVAGAAKPAQLEEKAKLERDLHKAMKGIDKRRYAVNEIPDVGYSGFTPSTDGQFVYAWFGDGVATCFDLAGDRKWIRIDQQAAVEHGFSASPLLVDGKFVALMRGLIAIDAKTGRLAWQTPIVADTGLNPANFTHGSLAAVTIGDTKAIVVANGTIVRASDGRVLWRQAKGDTQSCPSPVIDGRRVCLVTAGNSAFTSRALPDALAEPLTLTDRTVPIDLSGYPKHYLPWHLCSPIVHEGLAYLVNNAGVLSVVDVDAGKVLYQRMLDLDVFQSHNEGAARGVGPSPVMAGGKYLYFFGNNGAAVVIEAGRTYKQVAKNKLENTVVNGHWAERQERFVANPIFDGNRLIVRGEGNVYAVEP